MSAYTMLKETALAARKARQKQNAITCSTILGELETIAKRTGEAITDEQLYKKIKKTIETNSDNLKLVKSESDKEHIIKENNFLNDLLPKQLSEDEIRIILTELKPSNIGQAMKHLNTKYTGRFNGGIASKIARELI